jgi:hypothetical protein
MLWIALGSSAIVAALYYAHYRFYNYTTAPGITWEDGNEWDAKRVPQLSATLDERFARF